MTASSSMPPAGRRRGRRVAVAASLVAVFAASLAAGWAVADPDSFGGALAAATSGRSASPAPAGAATPAPAASPAVEASPAPAVASPAPSPAAPAGTAAPADSPPPAATPSSTPTPSAAATATPSPTVPPKVAARLDRALQRVKKSLLLPGVEATVLFPDGSAWTGALGMADVKEKRRVEPTTPFAIASVTKTFTAALILRYVDEGLLRLDEPLARFLPDWPNADRISIRMLLNHTSGVPDFFQSTKLDKALNKNKKKVWARDDVLEGYVRPTPVFAPGAGWAYSNTNYVLLGMVAEAIGKAPWEVLVHRELIDPLGLDSTYVQAVDEPPAAPAVAYRPVAGDNGVRMAARTDGTDVIPFTSVVTAAGAAGAIASTTSDLARWAEALYGGDLLSPATRKKMLTFVEAYAYGRVTAYGLGASRVKFGGRTAYGHTGALSGTRAAIRHFPKEGVTIAVLFNRETFVGDDVVRVLARALYPAAPASPSPGTGPATSAAP